MEPIHLEYTLTLRDVREVERAHRRQQPTWLKVLSWLTLAIFVSACTVTFLDLNYRSRGPAAAEALPGEMFLSALLGDCAYIVFLGRYGRYTWPWRAHASNPCPELPQARSIDDTGIGASNAGVSSQYDWDVFRTIVESPSLLLLPLPRKGHYVLIPKRAAKDEAQLQSIRDILRDHISPPTGGFPLASEPRA